MAVLEELPVPLVPPDGRQSRRLNRAAAYDSVCLRQRLPAAASPGAGRVPGLRAVDSRQAPVRRGRSALGAIRGREPETGVLTEPRFFKRQAQDRTAQAITDF